jgi:hypothetical protein
MIIGIIDIMLISRHNQALNHELEDTAIIVLEIKIKKNITILFLINIKKRT